MADPAAEPDPSPAPAPPAADPPARQPRIFYGWYMVASGFAFAFAEAAVYNPFLSIFVIPLQDEFGWSRTLIAGATTAGALAGIVVSPFAGRWIDRWGPRRFLVIGGLLIALGLFALAFVQELWQFYVAFALGRMVAMAMTNLANSAAVSNWFIRRRGTAVGIALLGERAGQTFLPLLVTPIILLVGWRAGWVVAGALALVLTVIPSGLIVRRRPEDRGLLPDGDRAVAGEPPPRIDDPVWTPRQALRSPAFWQITLAISAIFLIIAGLNLHLVSYLQGGGLTTEQAVLVLSIYSATGIAGGLLGGLVNDRIGVRWTFTLCLSGAALAIGILLLTGSSLEVALAFALVFGLFTGGIFTLTGLVFPSYFGRTSQASIRGLAVPLIFTANAFGPVIAGAWFDGTGSYTGIFLVFLAMGVAAALLAAFAPVPRPPVQPAPSLPEVLP